MSQIDPTIVALLEDIEIALIVTERVTAGPATPLSKVAALIGVNLDEL